MQISHGVQTDVAKALYDERFVSKARRHVDRCHVACLIHKVAQPVVHALMQQTATTSEVKYKDIAVCSLT